jgi:hypothetical protein
VNRRIEGGYSDDPIAGADEAPADGQDRSQRTEGGDSAQTLLASRVQPSSLHDTSIGLLEAS